MKPLRVCGLLLYKGETKNWEWNLPATVLFVHVIQGTKRAYFETP